MLENITPLILTYNEAPNIGRTLGALSWARDIVIVDSFSTDETLAIISRFPKARLYQRKFDDFAGQCNFGLTKTKIASAWVLNLDADYVVTSKLVEEIRLLEPAEDMAGFRVPFIYCIKGRLLRSGIYPPVTVLFRKTKAIFKQDGHAHRVVIDGKVGELRSAIMHDDRKPLSRWLQAQLRYTQIEAIKLADSEAHTLDWKDRIRRMRVIAPLAMLFYCLVVRGGILDGWYGLYYASQRMFSELLLSLYLIENDLNLTSGYDGKESRCVEAVGSSSQPGSNLQTGPGPAQT